MIRPLTHEDGFLMGFAAAIEMDQIRVDGLPPDKSNPEYSDGLWREWRRCHLKCIDRLLPTVDKIPSGLLQERTQLAITHEPSDVRLVQKPWSNMRCGRRWI
jgi:hypothetical protein